MIDDPDMIESLLLEKKEKETKRAVIETLLS